MNYRLQRQRKRLSQYEVARLTGIPQSRISLIENDYVKPSCDEEKKLRTTLLAYPRRTEDKKSPA